MRLTQPMAVSGYVHWATILLAPCLVSKSIITQVCLAPTARSIAPPTAGMAPGSPVLQLARSPVAET